MAPVTAPPVGADPQFDEDWAKVWDAITTAGNPAKLDEAAARDVFAERLSKFADRTYASGETAPIEDMPEEQKPHHRVLVIPHPGDEPLWWDDPVQAEFVEHFILTRRALGGVFAGGLLITGPAGVGKTTSIIKAVERINATHGTAIGLLKMDCATITDPQKWFGRREVDGKGTRYEKSDLIISIERGDVILLDDVTRLHPYLHNGIMSFLDGSNAVHLSDLNVTVKRHPQTVFLATANIGVQFSGTHRMDWAMRERFPYTVERDWPPRDVEIEILVSHTGCDRDGAANLVDIGAKTRAMFSSGDLRSPISTRILRDAAWMVASGMSEREALEVTAVPLYDPDANGLAGAESERQRIRALIDGRFGRGR